MKHRNFLSFLLVLFAFMQTLRAQSPPSSYVNVPIGDQTLTSQSFTTSSTWYKWTTSMYSSSVGVRMLYQGSQNLLSKAKLYTSNGSTLTQIWADTLRDSTMNVYANAMSTATDVYLEVTTVSVSCAFCPSAYPVADISFRALGQPCATYTNVACQLVKDGGFEYSGAVCGQMNITAANQAWPGCFWATPNTPNPASTYAGTSDRFDACAPTTGFGSWQITNANLNFGNNGLGTMSPHGGSAYAGAILLCDSIQANWGNPQTNGIAVGNRNHREYIGEPLVSPMLAGTTYSISMWVRLAHNSRYATRDIHMSFSNGPYTQPYIQPQGYPGPIPWGNNPVIGFSTTAAIVDTGSWRHLTAVFTPTVNYSYITIGNFQGLALPSVTVYPTGMPPLSLDRDQNGHFPQWTYGKYPGQHLGYAYYYFDDISIVPTSAFVGADSIAICNGSSVTIGVPTSTTSPLGTFTYTWTSTPNDPTLTAANSHSANPTVTPTVTTKYILEMGGGCNLRKDTVTVSVTNNTVVVTASVTPTNPCSAVGTTFTLTANGGATYTWSPGGQHTPSIVVTPTTTASYTVSGSVSPCTSTTSPVVTVTVFPGPQNLTINGNATICNGSSTTLTASISNTNTANYGYVWQPGGATTASISVSPTATTIYTVTCMDNTGCGTTAIRTFTVNVINSSGPLTVNPTTASLCAGTNTVLTASGMSTYTWQPGGATTNTISITPSTSTIYTVTGAAACTTTQTKTVSVTVASQSVTASVAYPNSCGNSMTLTATGSTSYTWQPGGLTGTPITVFPSAPVTYTVKGAPPCNSTATVLVNPGIINPVCVNTYTGTALTIVAGTTLTVPNGTVYHNYRIVCNGTMVFAPGSSTSGFDASSVLMGPNASIVLPNNSNVSIQNSHIYGCTSMWNGISLPTGNSVFSMGYTLIEDAKTALNVPYATGSNQITLTNNVFNKNNIDIHYVNAAANTITIERNIFASRCTGFNPPTVMIPSLTNASQYYDQTLSNTQFVQPINNGTVAVTSPSIAIWIDENGTANGNGSLIKFTDANIIDKHQIGIKTIDVNGLTITKQVIMNGMPGVSAFGTPLGKLGIYLSASTLSGYKGTVTIGGNNAANAIGNMDNGIWVLGGNTEINTKIRYNNITNIAQNGISYYSVNTQGNLFNNVVTHTVTRNTIASCKGIGIYCSNAGRTNTRIDSNSVNNTGMIAVSGNTVNARGIYIQEVANPVNARYTVNNNALSLVVQGVIVANTRNVTINNNQINMAYVNGGAQGINLTNCTAPTAKNNVVKGYGWQTSNYYNDNCMVVQDCPQGFYQCNEFDHTLYGNTFTGQSLATTLYQNIYDNCNLGIMLSQDGFIDVQDDPTNSTPHQPADNKFQNWGSLNFNTYAMTVGIQFTNGQNSPFYIRNSGNFVMPNNGAYSNSPQSSPVLVYNVTNAALPSAQCSGNLVPRPSDNISSMLNGGFFSDERAELVSQQELYRFLKSLNPSQLNGDMTNYLNDKRTKIPGRKAEVEDSISAYLDGRASALNGAMTALSNWPAQTDLEYLQLSFYGYYLAYLSGGIPNTNIEAIRGIAQGCPYSDGTVVWQARALMKVLGDTNEYRNDCENLPEVETPTAKFNYSEIGKDGIYSTLFPNPNDGNFSLKLSKSVNLLNVEVYDITGRALCAQEFAGVKEASLSCKELKDGIYLVKIFVNGQFLATYRMAVTH